MFWMMIYNAILLPILFLLGIFTCFFNKKIREGFFGRLKTFKQLKVFMSYTEVGTDIYWFHAASLGEYEQIKPVLAGLKEIEPSSKSIVSFFSPSGYNYVNDQNIDCKIYLPFDFFWIINRCLKIVNPKKIILAAYDVWPNLIWRAEHLGIKTTLFAARFSSSTSKLLQIIKNFYRYVYGSFSAIYTISKSDNELLQLILHNSIKPILRVLGNPRYDEVKTKADSFTVENTKSVLQRPKKLLLGSIHSEDENIIMDAIVSLMNELNDLSLIWAYHEPKDRYLDSASTFFKSKNFSVERLSQTVPSQLNARVCLVDTIGQLSQLYWQGQITYIGGGFSTGVHNVMEPAIARLPIFFGPRYNNSHEAEELIKDGGGFYINSGTDLYLGVKKLFNDHDAFIKASYASTNVVHRNLGSATRVVRNIIHD
jgi:3-deoxy-D-manno-octulosonic-acid transferase